MKGTNITDANFEQELNAHKGPYFLEFFATWCPHCQRMGPIIETLEAEYKGKVKFFLLDIDKMPATCAKYNVSGVPSMFFYDGKNVKQDALQGEQEPDDLRKCLDNLL